jgi:serine/threonine-protein kinase RsbW
MTANMQMELVFINPQAPDAAYSGDWIDSICRNFGMSDPEAYQVRTCVVEAVNNALEHGAARSIVVRAWPAIGRLAIEIDSAGAAEPPPLTDRVPADPDPLADRGRGLAIIRAWMDSVRMERRGSHHVMCMAKRPGSPR